MGDREGLSQALPPWLHTQTAGNMLFSGRLPETYERVRSMPRIDTKDSLPPQEGTLCSAGLPQPLLAPLAFHLKSTDCFPALINPLVRF